MTKQQTVTKIGRKGLKTPSEGTEKEYRNLILKTITKNRKAKFTQPQLRKALKMSNSYCNKCLRKLVDQKLLKREQVGNKFFYSKA